MITRDESLNVVTCGDIAIVEQGAQVVHWQPAGHPPILFASSAATYQAGQQIRAGVPIVFPWFGTGPTGDSTPAHGYARFRPFTRLHTSTQTEPKLRYRLEPTKADDLPARLDVAIAHAPHELRISATVHNTSSDPIEYDIALHTYLAISDVETAAVEGLDGHKYEDRLTGRAVTQTDRVLRIEGPLTRLYEHTGPVALVDAGYKRSVTVTSEGANATVIWNPGEANGRTMSDLGNDEWRRLICIEACWLRPSGGGLDAGESHTLAQTLTLTSSTN